MGQITVTVLVLQYFATIIAGVPSNYKSRISRQVSQSNTDLLNVVQLPEAGLADHTDSITSCVNVRYPKIPTRLALLGNTQLHSSYKIRGYSTDCSGTGTSAPSINLKFDGHINRRYPICSFQLNHKPLKPVTVAFLGEGSSEYIVTLSNMTCHSSICFSPRAVYANSVSIKVNEANSKHSINIFSDINCNDKINHSKIKNGNDLVKITRKDSVEIKSFYITSS